MTLDLEKFRLPDSAFWNTGQDRALDPIIEEFKTEHFGPLIDAPRQVDLTKHSTLPLFAYFMGTYEQLATRSFTRQAILVTVHPDQNHITISRAAKDDGDRVKRPKSKEPEELPDGYLAEIHEFDLRELAGLQWKPGRILTQILILDLASNRVETVLKGGAAFEDAEKEKFLADERSRQDPPAPFPILSATAYQPQSDSPAIPETEGLALTAPRVAVLDGKSPVTLAGAFRLPVAPEELVKPASTAYNRENGLLHPETKTPYAACLTIHLVAIPSGAGSPTQFALRIPVTELAAEGKEATGHFAIDLTKLPSFPLGEATVFLYGYAKAAASGAPVTIGLIDRRPEE